MSNKSPFGSASHLENMGSWKAGSPTSNPRMLKSAKVSILSISTIVHWISLVCSSHVSQLRAQSIPCNPNLGHNDCIVRNTSWRPQLRDQTLCFSAWDSLFPVAATKGWAWCNHNAGLMERAAALRSFKLLVGSGCLEFQNGMAGMDPETNMSSHGANICGWNAHSPVSNPRRLKALSAVVTEEHNQYIVTLFGHHNSVTKPSASLHEAGFLQLQRIWEWCKNVELVERAAAFRGVDARNSKKEWREWIPYTNMSNKSPFGSASHFANIVSWNAGGPTSNLRRLKALFAAVIEKQSVYCNNSWRPQLRDQTLCFSAWDGSFFCSCNEGMGVIQA